MPVQLIDPNLMLEALARKGGAPLSRRTEVVSYYRRPQTRIDGRPIAMPGWIIWSDTQPGKRDDMISRGFIPLFHYGRVGENFPGPDAELFRRFGPWGAILSRPHGPAEFPVDQILTFRWYRPEMVGSPEMGYEPMLDVRFPQLVEAVRDGMEIKEYTCPECSAITYLQPIHLARHLRNSHDWDRADILTWGNAIGIDFSREFRPKTVSMVNYEIMPPPEAPEPEAVGVPVVQSVTMPTLSEAKRASQQSCIFCGRAKAGYCKKHAP